jgi:hypothetical protein
MMVRTLKICIVDPDPTKTQAFLSAHLSGGLWSLLARQYYPIGFLGVRTFRSRKTPSIFALIGYWTSPECLEVARQTPAYLVLKRFQRNLAISTIDCGVVRVPLFETDERLDRSVTAQAGTAARVTTPCAATVDSEAILLSEFTNHPHLWARFKFLEALYEINALALHHDPLFCVMFLNGCRSTGSQFLGKWVNKANPTDSFQVVRNGDEFLIVSESGKIGAIYKDGALEVKGALFSANLTYVQKTDTLLGPGFFGNVEYKRLK